MTPIGTVLLSLLFIIVILGVYILGQAETIKQQKQAINEMRDLK